jgi:hypothetical protein
MDHLPRPSARNYQGQMYHPGTKLIANVHQGHPWVRFEDYTEKRGFSVRDLRYGQFPPSDAGSAAAVLQCWLFFGLLEELIQEQVAVEDFLAEDKGDNSELFLSTRHLGEYIQRWESKVSECGQEQKLRWNVRSFKVLDMHLHVLSSLYDDDVQEAYPDGVLLRITPPLAVLHEHLNHVRFCVIFPRSARLSLRPPSLDNSLFWEEMERKGWCPYQIQEIEFAHSPSLKEYAKSFRPITSSIINHHGHCSRDECTVNMVDEETYTTKHVSEECKCEFIKPDIQKIADALNSGCIPLIGLDDSGQGIATHAKDFQVDDKDYIAISHVWADGMGSYSEQGLPFCLVKRLSESAIEAYRALYEDDTNPLFWIDSLCVPESHDERKKAIGFMSKTYSNASAVLVLDRGIQQIRSDDPLHEKLFLIFVSVWAQRLWTLSEMVLAKELVFQLEDGVFESSELFNDDFSNLYHNDPICNHLFAWLVSHEFIKTQREQKLDMIVWHLSRRTSTKRSDETIALAGICGLETSAYVPLDNEGRMSKFLGEYLDGMIHRDIITLPGDKLTRPGWRWAPRTFLACSQKFKGIRPTFQHDFAFVSDEGLRGNYYCLFLERPCPSVESSWMLHLIVTNTAGEEYLVMFDPKHSSCHDSKPADVLVLSRLDDQENPSALAGTFTDQVDENGESITKVDIGYQVGIYRKSEESEVVLSRFIYSEIGCSVYEKRVLLK